jgi:hypothetical protein
MAKTSIGPKYCPGCSAFPAKPEKFGGGDEKNIQEQV